MPKVYPDYPALSVMVALCSPYMPSRVGRFQELFNARGERSLMGLSVLFRRPITVEEEARIDI